MVRPVVESGSTKAWQLDHDYLAQVVLAEARQADRWAVALREGKARYDQAAGDSRRQWRTLLPLGALARVCWERARGRLTVGDAGSYLRVSAIRPAVVVLCLALLGAAASPWTHDWLLTVQARQLAERFGGSDEADAVLRVWPSPAHLRQRVHDLVRADEALLERAVRSNWPFAHAGLEPPRVREVAAAVRARLEREQDPGMAGKLAWAYAAVAARPNDAADVKAAASLRTRLEREPDLERGAVAIPVDWAAAPGPGPRSRRAAPPWSFPIC